MRRAPCHRGRKRLPALPPTLALLPRLAAVPALVLTFALLCPLSAAADGYNDWSTELPEPGELWLVPAVQTRLAPAFEAYWQAQFQCGLTERMDLILNAAGWLGSETTALDATLLQPRFLITEWLALSPGLAVQGEVGGTPLSYLPGVFVTLRPAEAWKLNLNALFYLPVAAPSETDLFAVAVLQRRLRENLAVYGEIDFWGSLRSPTDAPEIDVFVGVQIDIGDEVVNLNLSMPIGPSVAPQSVALGIWWAHGITINPLPR